MTIIAVQCRLASTRLPNKALLPLGENELFRWALKSLKKVTVDEYWVACDEDSFDVLSKIANEEGWNCFKGPQDDVLERYCLLAQKTGADVILRATADNPYLFYEAAQKTIEEFNACPCDYFTFTGLPHGSGVEIFSAKSLLKAKENTSDPYDHEHVGPSLYNHPESFYAIFKKAPEEWTYEANGNAYRTTVDTMLDYRKAWRIHEYLQSQGFKTPYSSEAILTALQSNAVNKPLLFVPAISVGRGTGHIRRVLHCVKKLKKDFGLYSDIFLYDKPSEDVLNLLKRYCNDGIIGEYNLVYSLPDKGEYTCIVIDAFKIPKTLITKLHNLAPVISLDEGSPHTKYIDYTLEIIPSFGKGKNTNAFLPELLDLPKYENRDLKEINKILISIGGEDPLGFSDILLEVLKKVCVGTNISIDSTKEKEIPRLRDSMHLYDLVITHFGFTAFEAAFAGCAVITVATSPIHKKLSKHYNLECITKSQCTITNIKKLLLNFRSLIPGSLNELLKPQLEISLSEFLHNISKAQRYNCPICNKESSNDNIVSRDNIKTIRKCSTCAMMYISFCKQEKEYKKDYFFDEYKNQYGKTYLEDFESIKNQGLRRVDAILSVQKKVENGTILDVGCAYGPFLSASKDRGFIPYGLDISQDAVNYVEKELGFAAKTTNFSQNIIGNDIFGSKKENNNYFNAITMWYVIEHFQNLDIVLKNVSSLLAVGGVFAFSTPNASGISRIVHKKRFFTQSPYDHFSIWNVHHAAKILKKYGFSVKKIVSTGIHIQRFPALCKILPLKIAILLAKIFSLGDTFEVYCIKTKDIT